MLVLEVGRYIENIIDISSILIISVSYHIGTFDIGFSMYRYRISDVWHIGNFSTFYYTFSNFFNINLKTNNYMSKIEYIICQCYVITSLLVQSGS